MKRLLVLIALAVLVGCQQPTAETPSPAPTPTPTPAPAPFSEIDIANWPTATEKPVRVESIIASDCRAPSQTELQALGAERKRHGPHYKPSIVVRTNPEAMGAFKLGEAPMPVGTTIIKEKHFDMLAKGPPAEYGAMIKREPGYDSAHGDLEYLYVVSQPAKTVTRGRLESCIGCHAHAKDKDYLFRTYLSGKGAPVSGW